MEGVALRRGRQRRAAAFSLILEVVPSGTALLAVSGSSLDPLAVRSPFVYPVIDVQLSAAIAVSGGGHTARHGMIVTKEKQVAGGNGRDWRNALPESGSIDRRRSRLPSVMSLLEEAVRERVFPGCAYGVLLRGEEPWAEAAGQFTYDADAPSVQPGTVFDLASLTKVMATTAAAMLLFERGRLDLEAPIQEQLPEFARCDPSDRRRAQVTVRMLLEHSSGLPGYVRLFETVTGKQPMIEACLRQPLTMNPGTRAEYSDIGFILLGHLLEEIAGEPLDRFCVREVFLPLGMRTACFCPPLEQRHSTPPTEDDRSFRHRVIQGEVHDENASVMGGVAGHAGLFSDVLDPLRLAECLLAGGKGPLGKRLFASETVELFAQRAEQPAGTSRALGWDTPSYPSSSGSLFSSHSVGHLGFTGTSLWIDMEAGVSVALLTNRTWPDRANQAIRALRPRFHDAVRHAILRGDHASHHCG
jgi:serine-type D-Ala-D-Ala carboxypeptidase